MFIFDDICEIGEDGICKRHKVKHEGRHLMLSQDKSSVGHGYRKHWDEDFAVDKVDFNDICEFDENGVCKRHKVKHEGQSKEWAKSKDLLGWANRQAWDRLVGKVEPEKDCGCGKPKGNLR